MECVSTPAAISSGGRTGPPWHDSIIADISISLDGFVTGPDPGPDNGLGTGGDALHTWAFSDDPHDRRGVGGGGPPPRGGAPRPPALSTGGGGWGRKTPKPHHPPISLTPLFF